MSRKNPPFRVKVRLPRRNRALIPPMVKYHYEKPVKLLPSLRDVLRVENFYGQYQQQQELVKTEVMTDDEDELRNNCENGDDTDVLFSGCYEMNGNGNSNSESVVNGILKTEGDVFNGVDTVKKEVFLPDIVTDVSGEGKLPVWCVGCIFLVFIVAGFIIKRFYLICAFFFHLAVITHFIMPK